MSGEIFANKYKVVRGNALTETQLSAANYPASGSYIDVSGCERFHVLIALGTVHNSDAPTFEIKQSDAADGTLDTISATYCKFTCTGASDGMLVMMTIETDKLAEDHHFVSCVVAGTVSNGSYGDIFFLLPLTSEPVAQNSTICPAANQLAYVG